jgi:diguanylate cyclase (GGDEF)-like protein
MARKIILVGQDKIRTTRISSLMDRCEIVDSDLSHFPSIYSAKSALADYDPCVVLLNIENRDEIVDFTQYIHEYHPFLPTILITPTDCDFVPGLNKKGIYHTIHPKHVNEKSLAQLILTAIEQKSVENELRTRDKILQTVNYAVEVFLSQLDWESRIHEVLERLGKETQSDRVYIYKNELHQGVGLVSILQVEWHTANFHPSQAMPETISGEYQVPGFERWFERMKMGEIIWGNAARVPFGDHGLFLSRDVQSLALTPIFTDQLWWGFIGYDQCRFKKQWSSVEVDALKTAAKILGAAVARKDAEMRLTHLATHDYLTNLPNRMLLEDRFEQAVARAERSNKKLGVIAIDLDKFKRVNDVHGHPFGDKVLVEIAWRLSEAVRSSDTCARMGGDEFTVIAEGIDDNQDVMRVMEKISTALKPIIIIDGKKVRVSASMGASIYPDHGINMEPLMKAADIALYQVKKAQADAKIYIDQQYSLLDE